MYSTGTKVLVVDDEPSILDILYVYLSEIGYECVKAATGEEALKSLSENYYDVILLDLKLPGITGMDIIREVKSICPETAVIVVTGTGDIQTAVEAMKIGAADYITKPFKIDEVNDNINRVLGKSAVIKASRVNYGDNAEAKGGKPDWMARLDYIARGTQIRLELEMGQSAKVIERTAVIAHEMDIPDNCIARWVEVKKRRNAEEMEFAASLLRRLKANPLTKVLLSTAVLPEDEPKKYHQN